MANVNPLLDNEFKTKLRWTSNSWYSWLGIIEI